VDIVPATPAQDRRPGSRRTYLRELIQINGTEHAWSETAGQQHAKLPAARSGEGYCN
jgi:hypothetical protein